MDSDSIEDYLSQNSDMDPIEDDSDAIYEEEIDDSVAIIDSDVTDTKGTQRSSISIDSLSESDGIKVRNRFSILDSTVIDEPSVSEQSRVVDAFNRSAIPDTTTNAEVIPSKLMPTTLSITSKKPFGSSSNKTVPSSAPISDHSTSAGISEKVVNVNSTKIIIKGISAMASNNVASVIDDEVKNIFPANNSRMQAEFDLQVKEFGDKIPETDRQQTSTPKIRREIKQLQKMVNESKILTEFINDQDSQRSRKVKKPSKTEFDHDFSGTGGDNESIASKSSSRSRSLSRNMSPIDSTVSGKDSEKNRRNMRSQNAEFSAKHYKFLRGIHQNDSDASDNNSDIEMDKPVPVSSSFEHKPKTVHPPPKVNFAHAKAAFLELINHCLD